MRPSHHRSAATVVMTVALCSAAWCPTALAQQPGASFVSETLSPAGNGKTAIAFDHLGAIYITEKVGRVLRAAPNGTGGYQTPVLFADLSAQVSTNAECGLLGLTLDPDFANNRWVYVFFTTPTDQRLVRLTASADFTTMQAGSALVLLSGLPRAADIHKAGDIQFSPVDSGAIYVSLGDDGNRNAVACPSRNNLQIARPQCPDFYEGKFLKVDAATGRGLPSNPFWNGNADSINSRVWAVGFRNPFRFTFHRAAPSADVVYVSENGDGIDRLSRVRVGSNGGWGPCGDSGSCTNPNDGGPFIAPKDPNHKVLLTVSPSLVGIDIATGGSYGTNVLYFGRYGPGMRRLQLSGANFDQITELDAGGLFVSGTAVDLQFGPDGHLYYVSTGQGPSTGGNDPLRRYRFNATQPPVAAFTTTPEPPSGLAPLVVQYTDISTAPGSSIASRSWEFGDGGTDTAANPQHSFNAPGVYRTRLRVTNAVGQQAETTRDIRVHRRVTLQLNGQLRDARTLAAPALAVASDLRVYQADGSTAVPFSGALAPGNALAVPAGGVVSATITVDLTGDAVVFSASEATGDGMQPVRRGFVVPAGAGPHVLTVNAWLSDSTVAGRVRDTRGQALAVDVGLRRNGSPYALPHGRDYLAGSGQAATGIAHRVVSDALGWYHLPLRGDGAGTLLLDAVADTGTGTHGRPSVQRTFAIGTLEMVDIDVGLWNGGLSCTDLSAIAPTPGISYASQIQPIFDASCIGCHAPGATNSGGLDLTAPNSFAALVNTLSGRAPGVPRVSPGLPLRSFLFEKINCLNPQTGTGMRPGDPMAPAQQALFRDWIQQLPNANAVFANGFE